MGEFPALLSGGACRGLLGHQDTGFNPIKVCELPAPLKVKVVELSGQDHRNKETVPMSL